MLQQNAGGKMSGFFSGLKPKEFKWHGRLVASTLVPVLSVVWLEQKIGELDQKVGKLKACPIFICSMNKASAHVWRNLSDYKRDRRKLCNETWYKGKSGYCTFYHEITIWNLIPLQYCSCPVIVHHVSKEAAVQIWCQNRAGCGCKVE